MGAARKLDLDRRLDTHFATLRSSSLKEVLKRSAGNCSTGSLKSERLKQPATGRTDYTEK